MDWVLDEELGRGGMGVVWRARPRRGGEAVALKLVRDDVEVDADAFLQEAAAVARLHHPTLVHLVLERGAHTLRVTHKFTIRLFLAAHAGDAEAFDAVLHGEAPRARRQDLFASIGWMLVRGAAASRRHGDEARARILEDLRLQWGGWT